jgi:hypothetical protein
MGLAFAFETMEHGGEYPDTMPQAIRLIDAEGRSCIYLPITENGKVVDSKGFTLDPRNIELARDRTMRRNSSRAG